MSTPSIPGRPVPVHSGCGRPRTVAELALLVEELDRVVGELQDSLNELALPFDAVSRSAASDVIAAARRA